MLLIGKKHFLRAVLTGLLLIPVLPEANASLRFWIGASEGGVYAGELDTQNGDIKNFRAVLEGLDAYYIVRHPRLPILYAVIRTDGPSKIASYRIAQNGDLSLESELDGRPHGVSHINVSVDGRYLGAAYYRAGITGVYNLDKDGKIASVFAEARHQGKSVDTERQEAPHPHWAGFSADTRYLYVPDLGTDHIWVYELEESLSNLKLVQKAAAPAGSGPRHMAIHPRLDMAFVSDELLARVSRYALDRASGKLRYLDSMEPAAEATEETWHSVSDIRIHPTGRFLYLVNRGFDRVSVFTINDQTGKLTPVEREPVRGTISRNIAFDDSGQWALVAGRDSNTLALFEVELATGKLRYTGQIKSVPTPMSIVIESSK